MDYHQVHAVCTSNMAVTEIRIISLDMAFHENNGGQAASGQWRVAQWLSLGWSKVNGANGTHTDHR